MYVIIYVLVCMGASMYVCMRFNLLVCMYEILRWSGFFCKRIICQLFLKADMSKGKSFLDVLVISPLPLNIVSVWHDLAPTLLIFVAHTTSTCIHFSLNFQWQCKINMQNDSHNDFTFNHQPKFVFVDFIKAHGWAIICKSQCNCCTINIISGSASKRIYLIWDNYRTPAEASRCSPYTKTTCMIARTVFRQPEGEGLCAFFSVSQMLSWPPQAGRCQIVLVLGQPELQQGTALYNPIVFPLKKGLFTHWEWVTLSFY